MKKNRIIIVGAGSLGKALVNMLSNEEFEIVVVESEADVAKDIAEKTDTLVIKGDGTEMAILNDAGIEEAHAIVVVTQDDKTNLMICEIAKNVKVDKIIARVNKPENEELFIELGITSIVPIMTLALTSIKRTLEKKGMRVIAELGNGKVELSEIKVSKESRYVGKNLTSLKDAVVCTIYRDGDLLIPNSKMKFKEGDVIVIASKTKDVNKIEKAISKD